MIDYNKLNNPLTHDKYIRDLLNDINTVTYPTILSDLLKSLSIKLEYNQVDSDDVDIILEAIRRRNKILLSDSYKNGNNHHFKANYENWERENRTENYNTFVDNDNSGGTTNSQVQNNDKVLSLSPTSVSSRRGAVSLILILTSIAVTSVMYTLLFIAQSTR